MNDEKKTINSGELSGCNRCQRKRHLNIKSYKNDAFKKSVVIKNVLKEALNENWSKSHIKENLTKSLEEIKSSNSFQKDIQISEITDCIYRYISSETRMPLPGVAPMDIDIFQKMHVLVAPDFIFRTGDTVEVVKIKTGKPDITQNGKKRDACAKKSLELYALFCYGREIIPDGKKFRVTASYYYLRKSNDSVNTNVFDSDFFDKKGKNVIFLSAIVSKENGKDGACTLDDLFEPQFEEFCTGDTADNAECTNCNLYDLCNYKKPPKPEEKEHFVMPLRSLDLTAQQEQAIAFSEGIARINAGAGAGKTLVVALRTVNLLLNGVKPEEILMLTFTDNGASEMKERVRLYNMDFGTKKSISCLTATTFNSFCNSIIIKEYKKLGFSAPPTVIDDIERASIIESILTDNYISGIDYRNFDLDMKYCKGALAVATEAFKKIKTYKLGTGDEQLLEEKMGFYAQFVSGDGLSRLLEVYQKYDALLKANNLIEYADQELLFLDLVEKHPAYLDEMGFKHIIVDEFQDSNERQLELITKLKNTKSFKSLMVVGDDSQAIFSFRDTSPKYIINFFDIMDTKNSITKDFYLLDNYRSTPEIISLANQVNALNKNRVKKNLVAKKESLGQIPVIQGFFSKDEENFYIAEKIQRCIENGQKPEDIAYIAMNRSSLLKMGDLLTDAGIPWVMINPEPVLENPNVLATLSLAKAFEDTAYTEGMVVYINALYQNNLLEKEADIPVLLTGLKKNLTEAQKLPDSEKRKFFHDFVGALNTDDELYNSFLEKLLQKKDWQAELTYLDNFRKYGQKITYKRAMDYPGVVLTTAHSSKGLEWDTVFCSLSNFDCKELHMEDDSAQKIEEMRRLVFVALTRAKNELFVTSQYIAFGNKVEYSKNMFLEELYEIQGKSFPALTEVA